MNKYELTLVFNPNLDDEAYKAEFDKVRAAVERYGGTVDKVDEWGKRRLAYEIKKNSEGIYAFLYFSSESQTPGELESRLRINENVLRYLIVRQGE